MSQDLSSLTAWMKFSKPCCSSGRRSANLFPPSSHQHAAPRLAALTRHQASSGALWLRSRGLGGDLWFLSRSWLAGTSFSRMTKSLRRGSGIVAGPLQMS